jgi:hypothetical protein
MEFDKDFFYIDIDPKVVKMGIKLRPLILSADKLLIGNNEKKFGFKNYITDPKVFLRVVATTQIGAVGTALTQNTLAGDYNGSPDFNADDFMQIAYKDIASISKRKLLTGDVVIDLVYKYGELNKKVSFFACNQYNTLSPKTLEIYNILLPKVQNLG